MLALLFACAMPQGIDEDANGVPRADLAGCTVTTLDPWTDEGTEHRLTYDDDGHPELVETQLLGRWFEIEVDTVLDGQRRPVEQTLGDTTRTWTWGEGWELATFEEVSDEGVHTEDWTWHGGYEISRRIERADGTSCTHDGTTALGTRVHTWEGTCGGERWLERHDWAADRREALSQNMPDFAYQYTGYDDEGRPLWTSGDPIETSLLDLPPGDHTWDCP